MTNPLTLHGSLSELRDNSYLPIGLVIVFLGCIIGLITLGTTADYYYISLAIIGAIPLLYLMVKYPRIWIYLIALTNIYFFYERDDDVSILEIIIAVQYLGSLVFWMFWILLVKREKIIFNIADFFVMFYMIIIVINSLIAYMNSNEMLYWAREAANLCLISLYFPIRKYFTEKNHLVTLLIIYSIVVTASAFLHFYTYMKFLQGDIHYAFQLMRSIRVNQTLFTAASVFGFIFTLYIKKRWATILLIIFTSISIVGLITSFSRTFWVILLFEIIIVIFYLSGRQRIKLIIYTLLTTIILTATLFFVLEDKSKIMFKIIENRFVSTGRGTKDVSVQARFVEYGQVWKGIKEYPMAGNGLARKVVFWNILESSTARARFIHNGYLFIMYRMGIPAMLVCFFPYFYYLKKGEKLSRKTDNEFYRLLSVGSFLAILLMLISNFTAAQIIQREAAIVTALSFAFIGIVIERQKLINKEIENNDG